MAKKVVKKAAGKKRAVKKTVNGSGVTPEATPKTVNGDAPVVVDTPQVHELSACEVACSFRQCNNNESGACNCEKIKLSSARVYLERGDRVVYLKCEYAEF